MNKKQLKKELHTLGVPVYNTKYIKKNDIVAVLQHVEVTEITAGLVPLDFVKKVIDVVRTAVKKGKKEADLEKLNKFVKDKTSGDLMNLAKSAIEYFKQKKLEWEDGLGLLQNEYQPAGLDIIPWSFLKRQLEDLPPDVEKLLPRAFVQEIKKSTAKVKILADSEETFKVFDHTQPATMKSKTLKCTEADLEKSLRKLLKVPENYESKLEQPKKGSWVFKTGGKEYSVTKYMGE